MSALGLTDRILTRLGLVRYKIVEEAVQRVDEQQYGYLRPNVCTVYGVLTLIDRKTGRYR